MSSQLFPILLTFFHLCFWPLSTFFQIYWSLLKSSHLFSPGPHPPRTHNRQIIEVFSFSLLYIQKLLRTAIFLHSEMFKGRSFCTGKLLRTEAFTQRSFYTQQAFTHTHSKLIRTASFYTGKFLHREACAQRSFPPEKLLHRKVLTRRSFAQRSFYTEELLHRETFVQRSFYTEKLVHTEAFTQKNFAEKLLHRHCTLKPDDLGAKVKKETCLKHLLERI